MIDIHKQILFWREGAIEDLSVAVDLINRNHVRHGLFFAHLALEKILKAHVCRATHDISPRLHNLIRLSELTGLIIQSDKMDILAELNSFNIEGRYPDSLSSPPSPEEARIYMDKAEEVFKWLIKQL